MAPRHTTRIHWIKEAKEGDRHLVGKDMSGLALENHDLSGLWIDGCNFSRSQLIDIDFSETEFRDCQFLRTSFIHCDFTSLISNFSNFMNARFQYSNFSKMRVRNCNFNGADFLRSNPGGIDWNYTIIGLAPAPEGDLIGWGKKHNVMVKLLIPALAKRSWATTRKLRCEYAKVLEIRKGNSHLPYFAHRAYRDLITVYRVGEIVYPDSWDPDRWRECSHGIHFFLTEHEAAQWI